MIVAQDWCFAYFAWFYQQVSREPVLQHGWEWYSNLLNRWRGVARDQLQSHNSWWLSATKPCIGARCSTDLHLCDTVIPTRTSCDCNLFQSFNFFHISTVLTLIDAVIERWLKSCVQHVIQFAASFLDFLVPRTGWLDITWIDLRPGWKWSGPSRRQNHNLPRQSLRVQRCCQLGVFFGTSWRWFWKRVEPQEAEAIVSGQASLLGAYASILPSVCIFCATFQCLRVRSMCLLSSFMRFYSHMVYFLYMYIYFSFVMCTIFYCCLFQEVLRSCSSAREAEALVAESSVWQRQPMWPRHH